MLDSLPLDGDCCKVSTGSCGMVAIVGLLPMNCTGGTNAGDRTVGKEGKEMERERRKAEAEAATYRVESRRRGGKTATATEQWSLGALLGYNPMQQ